MTEQIDLVDLILFLEDCRFSAKELTQHSQLVFELQEAVNRWRTMPEHEGRLLDPDRLLTDVGELIQRLVDKGQSRMAALEWVMSVSARLGGRPIDELIRHGFRDGVEAVLVIAAIDFEFPRPAGAVIIPFRQAYRKQRHLRTLRP